jgi:hypothetical protein
MGCSLRLVLRLFTSAAPSTEDGLLPVGRRHALKLVGLRCRLFKVPVSMKYGDFVHWNSTTDELVGGAGTQSAGCWVLGAGCWVHAPC